MALYAIWCAIAGLAWRKRIPCICQCTHQIPHGMHKSLWGGCSTRCARKYASGCSLFWAHFRLVYETKVERKPKTVLTSGPRSLMVHTIWCALLFILFGQHRCGVDSGYTGHVMCAGLALHSRLNALQNQLVGFLTCISHR